MKTLITLCVAMLLIVGCKKETKEWQQELQAKATTTVLPSPPPCSGNYWQLDDLFYNQHIISFWDKSISVVYNNKVYVFDQKESEIRFYNGVDWDSIASYTMPHHNGLFDVGFVIGNKAYLGYTTQPDESPFIPFYEYDFANNSWNIRAGFPGVPRPGNSSVSFTINNKGYIVGGSHYTGPLKDVWEYDPVTNIWTQKASIPSSIPGRAYASGFSIGNKGYIATGQIHTGTGSGTAIQQFHSRKLLEFDPLANSWIEKAIFPGAARVFPSVFVIAGEAYAGGGAATSYYLENNFFKDIYKYNPSLNTWTKMADIPVVHPSQFGFSINSKGYVVFQTTSYSNPDFMLRYIPWTCIGTIPL